LAILLGTINQEMTSLNLISDFRENYCFVKENGLEREGKRLTKWELWRIGKELRK